MHVAFKKKMHQLFIAKFLYCCQKGVSHHRCTQNETTVHLTLETITSYRS
uniref:Uncharacterized protein n=1 Tax=Rhizophora mucronata TaxID=61149 RepID=A0A2P2N3B4_RHIMU